MSGRYGPDMSDFKMNEQGLAAVMAEAKAKLEAVANPRLRDAIRHVRDTYAGEPAGEVYERLLAEIDRRLGLRFAPNETNLRQVAQAIVDGDLVG